MRRAASIGALLVTLAAPLALAQETRVVVRIENLAPNQGTFQTPFWIGLHDGSFDLYNSGQPAGSLPLPGRDSFERICEDGIIDPLIADFADVVPGGTDGVLFGPGGPPAPGDAGYFSFVVDPADVNNQYFSYASMVLPSNDFCIANGNPLAHPVFDDAGNFVGEGFFVSGNEVLNAGTEVGDELPENTAFFGQAAPDTGVDENGNVGIETVGFLDPATRLDPPTILGTPQFTMGQFTAPGYPSVKVSFSAAEAITDELLFATVARGANEVPPVNSRAFGAAAYFLAEEGTVLQAFHVFRGLRNVTMAHLHLGPEGSNGPVVVDFLGGPADPPLRRVRRLDGEVRTGDLLGPLEGQPLDALIAEILAGNVYLNVHTVRNPSGELRGQLGQLDELSDLGGFAPHVLVPTADDATADVAPGVIEFGRR